MVEVGLACSSARSSSGLDEAKHRTAPLHHLPLPAPAPCPPNPHSLLFGSPLHPQKPQKPALSLLGLLLGRG